MIVRMSQEVLQILPLALCGLYYKHLAIINDDSSVIKKLGALLTDDSRVVINDRHMFILQPSGVKTPF